MARNSHFQFKQFRVDQDRCAMKVCSDACVLGAWAEVAPYETILDIGAGTGLLSLMVAQRNPTARVVAVEMDAVAAAQAQENIAASPFAERIQLLTSSIQHYQADALFDLIITNPPFFQSDLRSPDAGINQAHHADTLHFGDLLAAIGRLLKKNGVWNVLLPVEESDRLQHMAVVEGWSSQKQLLLTHQPGRRPFRKLTTYASQPGKGVTIQPEELFMYENDGKTYTSAFRSLLKEFYLVF